MANLEGKVALVTGAGSGIGRAMALRFAEEGAAVMCADLDEASAQDTAAQLAERGGRSAAVQVDVSQEAAVIEALDRTESELGGLDAVLNNAGIARAGWDTTLAVNLSGVYYGLLHGAHRLAQRGGGAIVSTSSIAGLVGLVGQAAVPEVDGAPVPGAGAYVAAKHGVIGLTRQFAINYAPRNVRVNAISPGYIDTPMIADVHQSPERERALEALHPMGRLGKPEEIAAAASFLLSDDASFITGVALPVDGGYTAR